MPTSEIKTFVEKALMYVEHYEFGHLKFSDLHSLLRERVAQFEDIGE